MPTIPTCRHVRQCNTSSRLPCGEVKLLITSILIVLSEIDRQSVASILDDDYTPPTPPHTTITPNENDEGIYLSWTQHMLRQQGFRPSSYNNDHGDSGSDSDSTNSSLTDDEEDSLPITPPHFSTSRSFPRQKSISNLKAKEEETKGWLTVPFCGFCFM
jgi:hypothetical protein